MKSSKTHLVLFSVLIFFCVFSTICGFSQTEKKEQAKPEEVLSTSEILSEFHELLVSLWHEALPNNDWKTIRETVPAIQEKTSLLMKTSPEKNICTERRENFDAKRKNLSEAVESLAVASRGEDTEKIKKSLDDVHTAYVQLASLLAPKMEELDNFHQVLAFLWHEALPKKDFKAIRDSSSVVNQRMDALSAGKLPQRYSALEKEFNLKREELKTSVEKVLAACKKKNNQSLEKALVEMHSKYHQLEDVLK
jgi:cytochrome c556